MQTFVQSLCLSLAVLILAGGAARAEPQVVATVPALHSIAGGILGDAGSPHLLVPGGPSPHSYSLKPSDAGALNQADIVIWAGPQVETFLDGKLATLAPDATIIEMTALDGIMLHHLRAGGIWDAHAHDDGDEHDDDGDEHDHGHEHHADEHHADEHHTDEHHADEHADEMVDGHVWLDPRNAIVLSAAIAETLASLDPENAVTYRARHDAQAKRLKALDQEIAAQLSAVQSRPFIVFHDAYQYFEARYGLAGVGSVTVSPDVAPGAKRVREIHARIAERGAVCVFAEPQFRPSILDAIMQGTAAKTAVLDPVGASLVPGPDLYPALLHGLADSMADCLGEAS